MSCEKGAQDAINRKRIGIKNRSFISEPHAHAAAKTAAAAPAKSADANAESRGVAGVIHLPEIVFFRGNDGICVLDFFERTDYLAFHLSGYGQFSAGLINGGIEEPFKTDEETSCGLIGVRRPLLGVESFFQNFNACLIGLWDCSNDLPEGRFCL